MDENERIVKVSIQQGKVLLSELIQERRGFNVYTTIIEERYVELPEYLKEIAAKIERKLFYDGNEEQSTDSDDKKEDKPTLSHQVEALHSRFTLHGTGNFTIAERLAEVSKGSYLNNNGIESITVRIQQGEPTPGRFKDVKYFRDGTEVPGPSIGPHKNLEFYLK